MSSVYQEFKVQSQDLANKVKEAIHEGNVRRIIIKDEKGHTFLEIPLTVAAIGVIAAPVVAGVVSIHDFMPRTLNRPHKNYTFTSGHVTEQAVAPADLATIYNLNPLFSAGTSGKGQTIVVVD